MGAFATGTAVWRARKLVPELPKLKSNGYIERKLGLTQWVGLNQISPEAVSAILTSEDDGFYSNDGLEVGSIWEALKTDLKSMRWKRGASTITQQVLKNTLLTRDKTLGRKIEELVLAPDAEKILAKNRILEIYLNTAQWSGQVYGIEGAAQYYFKIPAKNLTLEEGAYLAALLPNPVRYGRSSKTGRLSSRDRKVMDSILERMLVADKITSNQFEDAKKALLPFTPPLSAATPVPTPRKTGVRVPAPGESGKPGGL